MIALQVKLSEQQMYNHFIRRDRYLSIAKWMSEDADLYAQLAFVPIQQPMLIPVPAVGMVYPPYLVQTALVRHGRGRFLVRASSKIKYSDNATT
jgi:hypothetical protein